MVAGDQVHRQADAAQQVSRLLDQDPLHGIVFEGVSGQEDEIDERIPGQPDDPFPGFKALGPDPLPGPAHLDGLHAQLPVCGMEEFHGIAF